MITMEHGLVSRKAWRGDRSFARSDECAPTKTVRGSRLRKELRPVSVGKKNKVANLHLAFQNEATVRREPVMIHLAG
jgi:hypothetical protein